MYVRLYLRMCIYAYMFKSLITPTEAYTKMYVYKSALKITELWNVTPCLTVNICRRFGHILPTLYSLSVQQTVILYIEAKAAFSSEMAVNIWVHGFKSQKTGVITATTVRAPALILPLFWRLCQENLQISGPRQFITQATTTSHVSISCVTLNTAQVHPAYIFKIHINIILPSSASSLHWFLAFLLPHQNPVLIPLLPIYTTCPTLLLILDLIILIIQGGPKVGIQFIVYSIITVYLLLAHPVYGEE